MRDLPLAAALSLLCACHTVEVEPFRDGSDVGKRVEDETLLWDQSDEFDDTVASAGLLYEDEELRTYVQGVLERLFPEFEGVLHVRVLTSPVVNAFTLPSGSIYVHAGLLAILDSEAQLASVLAHEGSHFTHRHGMRTRAQSSNAGTLATVLSCAGLGLFAGPLAASSISGYSRDLEREADQLGFARTVAAGYEPGQAVEAFRRLLARCRAEEEESSLFFASHPALEERIASYEALSAASPGGGDAGVELYEKRTAAITRSALESELELRDFAAVLTMLELQGGRLSPGHASYYRGEALRQRGGDGDPAAARAAFEEALRESPDLVPAHRSLGRLCLRLGDRESARVHLARYLELAPDAPDRAYVENELGGIPR
jgi:predicted Zn-dependent protease